MVFDFDYLNKELKAQWREEESVQDDHPDYAVVRDGKCHEIVMWYPQLAFHAHADYGQANGNLDRMWVRD